MRAVTPLHPLWAPPPLGVHLSTPLTSVSHAYTIESEEMGAYHKTQECGGGGRRGWSLCLKPVMCQGFIFVLKKKSLIESALFKNWLQGLCLYEPVSSLLVLQYSAFTIPLPNWPIRSRLIFCATQSQTVTLSKYTKALKKKTDIDLAGFFCFVFTVTVTWDSWAPEWCSAVFSPEGWGYDTTSSPNPPSERAPGVKTLTDPHVTNTVVTPGGGTGWNRWFRLWDIDLMLPAGGWMFVVVQM